MVEVVRDPQVSDLRQFSALMAALGDGNADYDVMAQLKRVLESVHADAIRRAKESKGKLKLLIMVKCDDQGVASINYDVDITEPKPPRRGSILWHTQEGKLSLRDPKQMELGFTRVIEGGAQLPPRDVSRPQQPAQEVTPNA